MESISLLIKRPIRRKTKIHTKHQAFAFELAEKLLDYKSLGLYMRLAKKYDESYLRRILGYVLERNYSSPEKMFTFLVKKWSESYTGIDNSFIRV